MPTRRIAVCFYKYPRFQSVNNTVSSLFLSHLPRIGRSTLKLFPDSSQVVEKSPFFIAFPIRFLPFSIFRNTKPDTVLRHSDFQTRFCLRCPPPFSRQNKKPQKTANTTPSRVHRFKENRLLTSDNNNLSTKFFRRKFSFN